MRRGLIMSLLAHTALALAIVVGMGRFGRELPLDTPITVDIVTVDPASTEPAAAEQAEAAPLPERKAASPNPAPQADERPPRPEPPPPPEPEPEPPQPPPEPPQAAPAPPPDPPPPQPAPEPPPAERVAPQLAEVPAPVVMQRPARPTPPAKAAEAPKAEKQTEEPKPRQAQVEKPTVQKRPPVEPKQPETQAPTDDFASLLKSVEKLEKRVKAPEARDGTGTAEIAGVRGGRSDGRQLSSISDSQIGDMVKRQVEPCWNTPMAQVGGLRAELNIVLGPDGAVQAVVPLDEGRLTGDPVFRAFAEQAIRAVRACSPIRLPPESYRKWRNMIFNFDPSQMTG